MERAAGHASLKASAGAMAAAANGVETTLGLRSPRAPPASFSSARLAIDVFFFLFSFVSSPAHSVLSVGPKSFDRIDEVIHEITEIFLFFFRHFSVNCIVVGVLV